MKSASAPAGSRASWKFPFLFTGALALLLMVFFAAGLKPGHILFSNDGPLGATAADAVAMPGGFLSIWNDLYWLGTDSGSYSPTFTYFVGWILSPVLFAKFYPVLAQLFLGLSAWFLFRTLKFHPAVCALGGLAAALNTNFFSNTCWGLGTRSTSLAFTLLAVATFFTRANFWVRCILAGFCTGFAVLEGADNGAIFSLYVAAFVLFHCWNTRGTSTKSLAQGGAAVALVALCAAWIAAQTVSSLVKLQIQNVATVETSVETVRDLADFDKNANGQLDPDEKQERDQRRAQEKWDFATQWSLPQPELLRVVVPGLFGYLMNTPDGGNYWGRVGQQPGWDQDHRGLPRHSGSGEYAGILVILVALWASAISLGKLSPFTPAERRMVWFWSVAALVSLLIALGRHAPFYRILYSLPYFSTIRSPMKFMHPFHLSVMILFGLGLHGLVKTWLEGARTTSSGWIAGLKQSWGNGKNFHSLWVVALAVAWVIALLGWRIYSAKKTGLIDHLTTAGFDPAAALAIAQFSIGEVGLFVLVFAAAIFLLLLIQSGLFRGPATRWAFLLVGLFLVLDFGRADHPWIQAYNYREKYADNPLLNFLAREPYEHRVAVMPPITGGEAGNALTTLGSIYQGEWLQHQFPYHNIQALEIPQEPRKASDKLNYEQGVAAKDLFRYWQLTNTRYLLSLTALVPSLNQQLGPKYGQFETRLPFTLSQKSAGAPITVHTNDTGPFALIEFLGALPRVQLYPHWEIITNEMTTLARLASPAFNPHQSVIIDTPLPQPAVATNTATPGEVRITRYAPKRVELATKSPAPAILLLNDRYNPNWKVTVDGNPQPLLRANAVARGVFLPAGAHQVVFAFRPPLTGFFVTLSALLAGLALLGFVLFQKNVKAPGTPAPGRPAGSR